MRAAYVEHTVFPQAKESSVQKSNFIFSYLNLISILITNSIQDQSLQSIHSREI